MLRFAALQLLLCRWALAVKDPQQLPRLLREEDLVRVERGDRLLRDQQRAAAPAGLVRREGSRHDNNDRGGRQGRSSSRPEYAPGILASTVSTVVADSKAVGDVAVMLRLSNDSMQAGGTDDVSNLSAASHEASNGTVVPTESSAGAEADDIIAAVLNSTSATHPLGDGHHVVEGNATSESTVPATHAVNATTEAVNVKAGEAEDLAKMANATEAVKQLDAEGTAQVSAEAAEAAAVAAAEENLAQNMVDSAGAAVAASSFATQAHNLSASASAPAELPPSGISASSSASSSAAAGANGTDGSNGIDSASPIAPHAQVSENEHFRSDTDTSDDSTVDSSNSSSGDGNTSIAGAGHGGADLGMPGGPIFRPHYAGSPDQFPYYLDQDSKFAPAAAKPRLTANDTRNATIWTGAANVSKAAADRPHNYSEEEIISKLADVLKNASAVADADAASAQNAMPGRHTGGRTGGRIEAPRMTPRVTDFIKSGPAQPPSAPLAGAGPAGGSPLEQPLGTNAAAAAADAAGSGGLLKKKPPAAVQGTSSTLQSMKWNLLAQGSAEYVDAA